MWPFLILACSNGSDKDSGSENSIHSDDSPSDIIYPTGESVWFFDGIGGCSIGGGGTCEYNQAKALLVDDGWQVDYASSWRSLDPYRMMIMLAPNINGSGQLTNDEISDIKAGLSNGLRLVITAENSLCDAPAVQTLLEALEASISFTGESLDANRIIEVNNLSNHQINSNASRYLMIDPCMVDAPENIFADSEGRVYGGAERLDNGGEIILIGDSDFFDDSGYLSEADNSTLIKNLAWIDPALTP